MQNWTMHYEEEGIKFVGYQKALHEKKIGQEVKHTNTLNFLNTFINYIFYTSITKLANIVSKLINNFFENLFRYSTICQEIWIFSVDQNMQHFKLINSNTLIRDKETDASWNIFMIWKINFGLWTVGWAWKWKKSLGWLWATFEVPFF